VNFVIDAQLPRRLAGRLRELGYQAVHTLDLPRGNRTKDREIWELADGDQAVVVSKDADFVINRALHGRPRRLLVVVTGNIDNDELLHLFEANLAMLEQVFLAPAQVELSRTRLTVRD
jgi:predicted nuclease of predicted toxin-antitoxin system